MTEMIVICVLVVVVGIPFTLWWWKLADRWADAEHKRFATTTTDVREKIVVRTPDRHAGPDATTAAPSSLRKP